MVTSGAVTPAGRPLNVTCTAPWKPRSRVRFTRTVVLPPCRTTALSLASVASKPGGSGVMKSVSWPTYCGEVPKAPPIT